MKISPGTFAALAALWLLPAVARAENPELTFACVTKRVDQKTSTPGKEDITVIKEDWAYVVTLENQTMNDVSTLQVKYILFYKQEELGSLAGSRLDKQSGETKIDVIKGHDKAVFTTVPVKLLQSSLGGGRYYPNGAKTTAAGSLVGMWIRIYQNGNLIVEMSRPSDLLSKEKWTE